MIQYTPPILSLSLSLSLSPSLSLLLAVITVSSLSQHSTSDILGRFSGALQKLGMCSCVFEIENYSSNKITILWSMVAFWLSEQICL